MSCSWREFFWSPCLDWLTFPADTQLSPRKHQLLLRYSFCISWIGALFFIFYVWLLLGLLSHFGGAYPEVLSSERLHGKCIFCDLACWKIFLFYLNINWSFDSEWNSTFKIILNNFEGIISVFEVPFFLFKNSSLLIWFLNFLVCSIFFLYESLPSSL